MTDYFFSNETPNVTQMPGNSIIFVIIFNIIFKNNVKF